MIRTRSSLTPIVVLCAMLLSLPTQVRAELNPYRLYLAERGHIPWQSLSREEQDALRNYRGNWDNFSSERQERMRHGAQRYLELPEDKRRELERQHREYENLSPEERQRLREEYRRHRD